MGFGKYHQRSAIHSNPMPKKSARDMREILLNNDESIGSESESSGSDGNNDQRRVCVTNVVVQANFD